LAIVGFSKPSVLYGDVYSAIILTYTRC
jgi:hypothetical protein